MSDGAPISVSTTIDASPDQVYALVSDITRMGEWSPECVRCRWTDRSRGRFKGYNRNGLRRWTTTGTVVQDEPAHAFAFDVSSVFGIPVSRWSYRFEATADGRTTVTEEWCDRRPKLFALVTGPATGVTDRAAHNRRGMEATLARIKASAEAAPR